jgi:peptide/nickel transport system ATP-binding protein
LETSRGPVPTRAWSDDREGATGPLLVVDDLKTWFDTPRGILRAVDGVSLTLERSRTVGVVGESGSGKSVFARSIMGLLARNAIRPSGTVTYDGRDIDTLTRRERKHFWGVEIAMVFQNPMTSLNPVKTIGDHLTESVRFHLGMSTKAARNWGVELMELVGIPAPGLRMDDYPHEMSGGMRQRVTIAIALACDPKLLVADEPTTALDVTVQKQILDLLQGLQRERRMAMMLITHDLGVVAGRTDDVQVMYAGLVMERAPTSLLFKEMRHPYTEALMSSIPRVENRSHTRLAAISGRPPDLVHPSIGCRFAPRCRYAQARCLDETPPLVAPGRADHAFACFYPVGTKDGDEALANNLRTGTSAAGLPVTESTAIVADIETVGA